MLRRRGEIIVQKADQRAFKHFAITSLILHTRVPQNRISVVIGLERIYLLFYRKY